MFLDETAAHGKKMFPRATPEMKEKHSKKIVFGPCTLGRTWGTRQEPQAAVA
jgi:hypothetical protein